MPARGRVLVRKPETEDHFPGGMIVIPESSRENLAANQFEIIEVGEPELCEWPDDCSYPNHKFLTLKDCIHPIDPRIKKGAWVVIRPRSLVDAGDDLYLIKQTDVFAVFALSAAEASPEETPSDLTVGKEAIA